MRFYFRKYLHSLLIFLAVESVWPCTIAVVSGTHYGRPILWKNRDVPNVHQEVRYFDGEPFDFVGNVYEGETNRTWAGINSAGFGIVNTDTYNQGPRGTTGPDDGEVMYYALENFATIDEFQAYLDSTNASGRRGTHCYGVIDAFGGAAIFEAARFDYVRFDAYDNPENVLIRTNYADSGDPDSLVGEERRIRAEEIISISTSIDPELFLFVLARDLATEELDPYPLPFTGIFGSYPPGVISTHHTINRYYTSSSSVIVGQGKDLIPGVLWEYLGQPIVSIPVPVWVQAGAVPPGLCSPSGSELCDLANEFKSLIYVMPWAIDTYILSDLLAFFHTCERDIYHEVEWYYTAGPSEFPDSSELATIEYNMVNQVLAKYYEIRALLVHERGYDIPSQARIVVRPNPFNGRGSLEVFSPKAGCADVVLYDMSGRIAAFLMRSASIFPGQNSVSITTENLPSGIYTACLSINNQKQAASRVVVVK